MSIRKVTLLYVGTWVHDTCISEYTQKYRHPLLTYLSCCILWNNDLLLVTSNNAEQSGVEFEAIQVEDVEDMALSAGSQLGLIEQLEHPFLEPISLYQKCRQLHGLQDPFQIDPPRALYHQMAVVLPRWTSKMPFPVPLATTIVKFLSSLLLFYNEHLWLLY